MNYKLWIKILLLGLILHFVVRTWMTYILGIPQEVMNILAQRKEIFVFILGGYMLYSLIQIYRQYQKDKIYTNKTIWNTMLSYFSSKYLDMTYIGSKISVSTMVLGIVTLLISLIHIGLGYSSIGDYIFSFKYTIIAFGIVSIFYSIGYYHTDEATLHNINYRYMTIIKTCLVFGVLRYLVIFVKPGTLKLLGYDKNAVEGSIGSRPPAVYSSTREHGGLPRNQFLRERPIYYGFWLVAFWPFFYLLVLKNRKLDDTWLRRGLYIINIILTFSRAARGAFVIQFIVILYIQYIQQGQNISHIYTMFKKFLLPIVCAILVVAYFGYSEIFGDGRKFSNTGHINSVLQGIYMFVNNPVIGMGPSSVGPGSHHVDHIGFNPENQYLQVLIEYGLIGFVFRCLAHIWWLVPIRSRKFKSMYKSNIGKKYGNNVLYLSVGMIGVMICGVVLQPWSDQMTMYPWAILYGLNLGYYIYSVK